MRRAMSRAKLSISALPLPPASQILTRNLTPDPLEPTAAAFREIQTQKPSTLRRSRLLDSQAHFAYVAPCPLPFPFRVTFSEDDDDKASQIEKWLTAKEALKERDSTGTHQLRAYTSEERDHPRELLGIAPQCVEDTLPSLDIGDSLSYLGTPTLVPYDCATTDEQPSGEDKSGPRKELVDVLSGHATLASFENDNGYAPWSLRYSGHQFGSWAGQLGDGRAISILETPHPDYPGLNYELQLKGAGRTPFSRTADGLAVVRSSIREYLCAEAMHALSIPTTRSLAITLLPELEVYRETVERAAIVTRVAPSFIRIGSFQALNPPEQLFFFGGGQQPANYEALRVLGEWVAKSVLKLDLKENEPLGAKLVLECARRNAKMVAGWQAYGFMHGVLNTDNISVLGLTIDYGPYAFMDIYDPGHICNHSDEQGRYAFKFQPTMIIYALRALLNALSPLVGAEQQLQRAVGPGWAEKASKEEISQWSVDGLDLQEAMEKEITTVFELEYWKLMRKRLALRQQDETDPDIVIRPFLSLLEKHRLDFHSTFRSLAGFTPTKLDDPAVADDFVTRLLPQSSQDTSLGDLTEAKKDILEWLHVFAKRINAEKSAWEGAALDARIEEAKSANPRFILRQWVLEEVIKEVEQNHVAGRRILSKVLEMATHPFKPWGKENDPTPDEQLPSEERAERRFCGVGAKSMLGFQCSCSS